MLAKHGAAAETDAFRDDIDGEVRILQELLGGQYSLIDPKKAVTDLMERARADEFQPLSAAAVSNAISASLWTAGTNREQETRSLSDALSALGTGNASPIRERAARAENEVDGDGQFIGRCTDGMQWPGIDRAVRSRDVWFAGRRSRPSSVRALCSADNSVREVRADG